jgi:hypothetical protein
MKAQTPLHKMKVRLNRADRFAMAIMNKKLDEQEFQLAYFHSRLHLMELQKMIADHLVSLEKIDMRRYKRDVISAQCSPE